MARGRFGGGACAPFAPPPLGPALVQTLQDRTWFDRLYVDTRKSSSYLSVHANKPRSISHITLYQCHSVESTLIQGCLTLCTR